jgi:hypothetical protein
VNGAGGCDKDDFVPWAKLVLAELFALPLLLGGIVLVICGFYLMKYLDEMMRFFLALAGNPVRNRATLIHDLYFSGIVHLNIQQSLREK